MKKIMLSLLVVFILLSTLVVASPSSLKFNNLHHNLFVFPGDSLSYQVNVSSNYGIGSYGVDSPNFSISNNGLLTSNFPLVNGDSFTFTISVNDTRSNSVSTKITVLCSPQFSQSSQDSRAWLSSKDDLASSSHNAFFEASSLNLSNSLNTNISPDSLRVNSDGKIYFFFESTVFVYNPDLSLNFSIPITNGNLTPLTVDDLVLTPDYFIVSANNSLLLYSKNGTLIKQEFISYPIISPLKILNKLYFIHQGSKFNNLVSYDVFTLKEFSSVDLDSDSTNIAFDSDSLFVSTFPGSVSSFDLSLKENWYTRLFSSNNNLLIDGLLSVDSSNMLFVNAGSFLYALNASSGDILFSKNYSSNISNLVLLSDSLIAFQEGDSIINIVDIDSGSSVCTYVSNTNISSPLSSSSKGVIFGTSDAYDFIDFSCSLKDSFNTLNSVNFAFQPIITSDNVYLYSSSSLEKYLPQTIVVPEEKRSKDLKFSVSVIPGCAGGDTRFVIYDENSHPVSGADIHLLSDIGSFNTNSNEDGVGSIFLPKSHYHLDVSASGYETALGEFNITTCSAKGAAESAQEIDDIISKFALTDSVPKSSATVIPGSAMNLFPTFASEPSDNVQEEIKTSTSKVLSDQKESIFMFKNAKAFSLFMLLLIVLLIVIGIYVKFKVSEYKNSKHLLRDVENSIEQDINHVEKDVLKDVESAKDFIEGNTKK